MPSFGAKEVKELREMTGVGMMDCKKALADADGDMEAAKQLLRERGLNKAASRADRENDEGAVSLATIDNNAALVLLKCETDFSAKSEDFVATSQKLAEAALNGDANPAETFAENIEDLQLTKKENIAVGSIDVINAGDGSTIDTYLHVQDGRGVNGVVVEAVGVDDETLHQIALHIAFAKPRFLSRDEVPQADADKERAALLEITKAEGKPEAAWEKIVDGRLSAWYADQVLLEQGLHGDKTTVAETIGDGKIIRFAQAYIGA